MRSRHLTRNGRTPVFQIRVPKALDPALTLAPIRVTLGDVPNSQARRMADVLGGLARIEFARIQNMPMNDATPVDALPTLLGLGVLGQSRLSEDIAPAAIDGIFDLLAEVGAKRVAGDGNTTRLRPEVPIVATLTDENTARGMLGLTPITIPPKPDPIMAELAAIREMIGSKKGPQGPLFSVAAERFITGRVETYGDPGHPEIGYLRHQSSVFLALVGDKPVNAYDRADLQHFANELSWLPPNISKQEGYGFASEQWRALCPEGEGFPWQTGSRPLPLSFVPRRCGWPRRAGGRAGRSPPISASGSRRFAPGSMADVSGRWTTRRPTGRRTWPPNSSACAVRTRCCARNGRS